MELNEFGLNPAALYNELTKQILCETNIPKSTKLRMLDMVKRAEAKETAKEKA